MADKRTELSIIIRAIDKATAPLKVINDRLEATTKPFRALRGELGRLKETSGLGDLIGGIKGVGSAIGDLLSKVAVIGGLAGAAVAGVFHLVGEFDDLGDKAERLGVSVDFLANMGYAAERAGAPVGALDQGMESFSVSLGKARAGTGRMLGFLKLVSPELAKQVRAAKSNEEAFNLVGDAMAKLADPARRAALAVATVGDAKLAPLLSKGAAGMKELSDKAFKLHGGSLNSAAEAAGKTDDALHDLKEALVGVKGALVTGLAPALSEIIGKLTEWLVGHQPQIKEWAAWLGAKLPGAVSELVAKVQGAVAWVGAFVDKIGGWKTVVIGLAAFMLGPLIGAIGSLGVALMSTPLGWAVGAIAAVMALKEAWDSVSDSVKNYLSFGPQIERMAKLTNPEGWAEGQKNLVQNFVANNDAGMGAFFDGINTGKERGGGDNSAFYSAIDSVSKRATAQVDHEALAAAIVGALKEGGGSKAEITLNIPNAPPGTRVTTSPQSTASVDTNLGLNLWGLP